MPTCAACRCTQTNSSRCQTASGSSQASSGFHSTPTTWWPCRRPLATCAPCSAYPCTSTTSLRCQSVWAGSCASRPCPCTATHSRRCPQRLGNSQPVHGCRSTSAGSRCGATRGCNNHARNSPPRAGGARDAVRHDCPAGAVALQQPPHEDARRYGAAAALAAAVA